MIGRLSTSLLRFDHLRIHLRPPQMGSKRAWPKGCRVRAFVTTASGIFVGFLARLLINFATTFERAEILYASDIAILNPFS